MANRNLVNLINKFVTQETQPVNNQALLNIVDPNEKVRAFRTIIEAALYIETLGAGAITSKILDVVLKITTSKLDDTTGEIILLPKYGIQEILTYPTGVISWMIDNGKKEDDNGKIIDENSDGFLPRKANFWIDAIFRLGTHWFISGYTPSTRPQGGGDVTFTDAPNSNVTWKTDENGIWMPNDVKALLRNSDFYIWTKSEIEYAKKMGFHGGFVTIQEFDALKKQVNGIVNIVNDETFGAKFTDGTLTKTQATKAEDIVSKKDKEIEKKFKEHELASNTNFTTIYKQLKNQVEQIKNRIQINKLGLPQSTAELLLRWTSDITGIYEEFIINSGKQIIINGKPVVEYTSDNVYFYKEMDMSNNKIINLLDGIEPHHSVNLGQVNKLNELIADEIKKINIINQKQTADIKLLAGANTSKADGLVLSFHLEPQKITGAATLNTETYQNKNPDIVYQSVPSKHIIKKGNKNANIVISGAFDTDETIEDVFSIQLIQDGAYSEKALIIGKGIQKQFFFKTIILVDDNQHMYQFHMKTSKGSYTISNLKLIFEVIQNGSGSGVEKDWKEYIDDNDLILQDQLYVHDKNFKTTFNHIVKLEKEMPKKLDLVGKIGKYVRYRLWTHEDGYLIIDAEQTGGAIKGEFGFSYEGFNLFNRNKIINMIDGSNPKDGATFGQVKKMIADVSGEGGDALFGDLTKTITQKTRAENVISDEDKRLNIDKLNIDIGNEELNYKHVLLSNYSHPIITAKMPSEDQVLIEYRDFFTDLGFNNNLLMSIIIDGGTGNNLGNVKFQFSKDGTTNYLERLFWVDTNQENQEAGYDGEYVEDEHLATKGKVDRARIMSRRDMYKVMGIKKSLEDIIKEVLIEIRDEIEDHKFSKLIKKISKEVNK